MVSGYSGYGSIIKVGDGGSPEAFQTIPRVTNVGRSGGGREQIDTTSQDSVDGEREFVSGLKAGRSVRIDMNDLPADPIQKRLTELADSGDLANFQYIKSNGTQYDFAARVSNDEDSSGVDTKLTRSVTLTVSGTVTQTDP